MKTNYLNQNVSPAEDFFQYCTGNWANCVRLPKKYNYYSANSILSEKVKRQLNSIFTSSSDSENSKKIAGFYNLAKDDKRLDKEGIKAILDLFDKVMAGATTKDELIERCAENQLPVPVIAGLTIDKRNSDNHCVVVIPCLSGGSKEPYYSNGDYYKKLRAASRKYAIDLLAGIGVKTRKEAAEFYDRVFAMEKRIAKYEPTKEEAATMDSGKMYRLSTLSRLCDFDFEHVVKASGFDSTKEVYVPNLKKLKENMAVYKELDFDFLRDYTLYSFINGCCAALPRKYRLMNRRVDYCNESVVPRYKPTNRPIYITSNKFCHEIESEYINRYFDKTIKRDVEGIAENIKKAFAIMISEQEWLSEKGKESALAKLDAMKINIGYPEDGDDVSVPFDDTKSLVENLHLIKMYFKEYALSHSYHKKTDRKKWPMSVNKVNACFFNQNNALYVTAAFLQQPNYYKNDSIAEKLGSVGGIIGHELCHAFDKNGCRFDKTGSKRQWLSADELKQFDKLAGNMIDRFNAIALSSDKKANGIVTLNENLADYGGMKAAYYALTKIYGITDVNEIRKFFISYAQTFAYSINEQSKKNSAEEDVHSLNENRVNGILSMFTPWYEAFDVTEASPWYVPEEKRGGVW